MNGKKKTSKATAARPTASAPRSLQATLLRTAWLAILLGLAMEVLLLLFAAGFGLLPNLNPIVADLVKQLSWSVFVCVGLAFGTAASKLRAPVMGLLGLLAAPLAFTLARTLHKGMLEALAVAGVAPSGPSLLLVALIKGAEYGFLGAALGWVGHRRWGGMAAHAAVGLVAGVFFGGAMMALKASAAAEPLPTADLVCQGVNELLFPVGCSLVIFCAQALGERVAHRPNHGRSPDSSAALLAGRTGRIGMGIALILGIATLVVEGYLLYQLYTAPALASAAPHNGSASSAATPAKRSATDRPPQEDSASTKDEQIEKYVSMVGDVQSRCVGAFRGAHEMLLRYETLSGEDVKEMEAVHKTLKECVEGVQELDAPEVEGEKLEDQRELFAFAINELYGATEIASRMAKDPACATQAEIDAYDRHADNAATALQRSNEILGRDHQTIEDAQRINL
jgi:hypothetical protein